MHPTAARQVPKKGHHDQKGGKKREAISQPEGKSELDKVPRENTGHLRGGGGGGKRRGLEPVGGDQSCRSHGGGEGDGEKKKQRETGNQV